MPETSSNQPAAAEPSSPSAPAARSRPLDVVLRYVPAVLVWALVVVLALRFFSAFRTISLGVLAAAAVACMLQPLAKRIPAKRATRAVIAGLGFTLLAAGITVGLLLLMSKPVAAQLSRLPELTKQLDVSLQHWSQRVGISPPLKSSDMLTHIPGLLGKTGDVLTGVGSLAVSVAIALVFIFIGSIFMLAETPEHLLKPVMPALPLRRQMQVRAALKELGPKLRWWLIGHLTSMVIVGLVSWLGYTISGITFAIPLAALAGLAELVPTIGPIFAGSVAVLIASTQGSGQVAGAVATWAVVQTLESYLLLPMIMKRAVHMPAVITLFSVIFWGEVLGPAGLFMAIPLNLVIWEFFKHLVIHNRPDEQTGEAQPTPSATAPP